jgi:8-oxo-dGTP pyrophosphatase MutT (NUDIX family)
VHRNSLLEKLGVYRPLDDHEAAMVRRLRHFVETHADCFERTLPIGHITGSAWVVDFERAHALLTHHRKLNKWLQLGGHADGDPDVLRVALREAREESGLTMIRPVSDAIYDIDIHVIPARDSEPEHRHYDVRFLLEAGRAAPLLASRESRSLAWTPLTKVQELNPEESMARMVTKTPPL